MKCVITYFQNKRVSLPYIFNKYCYNKMKNLFPGDLILYNVFHNFHTDDGQTTSSKLTKDHLERTKSFIRNGKYQTIISHQANFTDFHLLPSLQIGIETAIAEKADLHLWIEDDAIVFDLDCSTWYDRMVGSDVGLYRYTSHLSMINCAFLLTSIDYDCKLIQPFKDYKKDELIYTSSSQIENLLWKHVNKYIVLSPESAIRHHPYHPKTSKIEVKEWLKHKIPEIEQQDLNLLDLDFE